MELVQRLDEIRAQSGIGWEVLTLGAQADRDYMTAFRQAGIDIDALPVKEAVDRITARRAIAAALLPAIDDWVAVRSQGKDQAATRRLVDVLKRADLDPWRQQVRAALIREDWSTLENLARSADLERQPAATLTFLCGCAALRTHRADLEIEVLRRAQWKYPADYWINFKLGLLLLHPGQEHIEEGMGYMRAARALRPQNSHPLLILGIGYHHLKRYDEAIACNRKAIELSPNYRYAYSNLGHELVKKGQYEEAIAAFEEAIKLSPNRRIEAYAGLSMIHSNCPDVRLRNPRRAAELAAKAVEFEPQASNPWTALGIARYRQSQWQEARIAFDKSLQLGTGRHAGPGRWPDAIDWFFLAMSNWQLGQKDQARQCYDRAVQGFDIGQTWQPDVEQLHRFRAEAEQLLQITDEKPTTEPPVELK